MNGYSYENLCYDFFKAPKRRELFYYVKILFDNCFSCFYSRAHRLGVQAFTISELDFVLFPQLMLVRFKNVMIPELPVIVYRPSIHSVFFY